MKKKASLHVGGLTIDVGNYEAFRNGEKLSLTLKEFELLKLLGALPRQGAHARLFAGSHLGL